LSLFVAVLVVRFLFRHGVRPCIGRGAKQRGKSPFEILLSADALDAFYDHIVALQKELSSGGSLLDSAITLNQSVANDPNRSRYEEAFRVHEAQFRESHKRRLELKRLPKFPGEDEFLAAANRLREEQILMRMGYPRRHPAHFHPRDTSQYWEWYQHRRNNALLNPYYPPDSEQKEP